jgi:hypothetical protein
MTKFMQQEMAVLTRRSLLENVTGKRGELGVRREEQS